MFRYKITNIVKVTGEIDYKGLDLSQIHAGSQIYDLPNGIAHIITEQEFAHEDITLLTDEQYEQVKNEQVANMPEQSKPEVEQLRDEISNLKGSQLEQDALIMDILLGGI